MKYKFIVLSERALEDAKAIIKSEGGKLFIIINETSNPFYTSLKPWNRKASDMWNFTEFLEFWGWRL
jgi:hypothetical protein